MIYLIAAISKNNVIGKDDSLPWRCPADLKRFKQLTTGTVVIMGRKTYESIGRPLPNRTNVVISKSKRKIEGCIVRRSPRRVVKEFRDQDVYIIGGEQIYEMFLPYVDIMRITRIHDDYDGDTYFPSIVGSEWKLWNYTYNEDEKNEVRYSFEDYKRIEEGEDVPANKHAWQPIILSFKK
jgi:dihydrofolate reductase